MDSFKQRFEIIYDYFYKNAGADGRQTSKLALSRLLGISQGKMQNWEKGQMPAAADIKTIHDKLGFSYDWLITGQGPQFENSVQADPAVVQELKDKLTATENKLAATENELTEANRLNRHLTAKLLVGAGQGVGAAGEANAV